MSDATARLTAALADRYRIERELGQGGMSRWPGARKSFQAAPAADPGTHRDA